MYFNLYRADVIKLTRSMVIKFSDIAKQINDNLKTTGYIVDLANPESWKYYLNLSGIHHETDQKMFIRSSDTLETIEFNKENLKIHLATLREFYPGSLQYNNLVRNYPEQEQLIRGILFPIDITTAIAAADGTILFMDNTLIEGNEDDLKHAIQTWVNLFVFRWYNVSYNLIDDFNLTTFLGNLYSKLPVAIMNLRLKNVNTIKAHSYYVKEYLASNGRLDEFFDYLDLRQRLWLYRNIRYLKRNSGKQYIWDKLVENILTPKGIPLISYSLEQDTKDLLTEHKSRVSLLRHDINFAITQDGQFETQLSEVLGREDPLARENNKVKADAELEITDKMGSDKYSSLPTKVLDSEVMDRSNSSVRTLSSVIMSHWLYLACNNKYRAYVSIPNPRTGEFMILSVKDAFILMIYCYTQSWERPLEFIPQIDAYDVLRDPAPNFAELRGIVDKKIISDDLIVAYQKLVDPLSTYISTEGFYRDCIKIHKNYLKQWEAYSFHEHHVGRSYCEQLVKRHYMNIKCKLTPEPITFFEYFKEASIDVKDLTPLELRQLASDCYGIATGANLVREITLGEVQKELLRLMGRLTSYPLQYLRNVNYTDFHIVGVTSTRVGGVDVSGEGRIRGNFFTTAIKAMDTRAEHDVALKDAVIAPGLEYDYDMEATYKIDPCVNVRDLTTTDIGYNVPLGMFGVRGVSIEVHEDHSPENALNFYED